MSTLMELIRNKKDLEQRIIDEAGEYTEDIEQLINDNSIQLKDKVDAYSYVMGKMDSDIRFLKERNVRTNELLKKAEKIVAKMKSRLYQLASVEGDIVGNEHKIKPYLSKVAKGVKINEVETRYITYNISFTNSQLMDLLDIVDDHERSIIEDNMTKVCKLSDLPKDHPAIIYELTETVK